IPPLPTLRRCTSGGRSRSSVAVADYSRNLLQGTSATLKWRDGRPPVLPKPNPQRELSSVQKNSAAFARFPVTCCQEIISILCYGYHHTYTYTCTQCSTWNVFSRLQVWALGPEVPFRQPPVLQIDGRLARFGDCCQRVSSPFLFLDPLLLVADDVEQQRLVLRCGQIHFTMLLVGRVVQRFAGLTMEARSRPAPDAAVELEVGRVVLFLPRPQEGVQALNQSRDFLPVEVTVVVVEVVKVGALLVLRFVVASLDSPHIGPVRR